jgi:hypothetical protein
VIGKIRHMGEAIVPQQTAATSTLCYVNLSLVQHGSRHCRSEAIMA